MARHCMRPGCDRPAAARLTYDTEAAAVWLDRPLDDGQPAQQVCSVHAATLTAPLGWTVTDRRLVAVGYPEASLQPPILEGGVSPFTEERPTARSSAEPDAPVTPDEEQAGVPESPAAIVESTATRTVEAARPSARSQVVETEHREGESPAAESAEPKSRGKLLERAFEWTGPQHSVLTTGYGRRPRRRD